MKHPDDWDFLTSPLAAFGLAILALLLLISAGRIGIRATGILRERGALAERLSLLKSENEKLAHSVATANSAEAVERLAKERLNLKNPGEEVVVVTPERALASANGNAGAGFWQYLRMRFGSFFSVFRR